MEAKRELNPHAKPFVPGQAGQMKHAGTSNKRSSRIQGGWAPDVSGRGRGRGTGRGVGRGTGRSDSSSNAWGARNPRGGSHFQEQSRPYPTVQPQQGTPFLEEAVPQQYLPEQRNFEQPQDVHEVVFMAPEHPVDVRMPTEPKWIEEDGEHVISEEPSGKSEVMLKTNFLSEEEADEAFLNLQTEIDWIQQLSTNRAGEEYKEPRMVCWYGEHPYAYSRMRMEAKEEWPPTLTKLKEKIEEEMSMTFNSVLANKYRSGKDGVAWHSDDEYGLRDQPKIASLSLGETRMFEMRKKPSKDHNPYDFDYSYSEKLKIPLTNGSLLLMTGYTQDDWQHQVPKEYHEKEMRINLTFRNIYPDDRFHRPYQPK